MNALRRSKLLTLLLALLVGCSAPQHALNTASIKQPGSSSSGIGGTGIRDHNGIGGTGKQVEEGIGGTGQVAQNTGGIGGTGVPAKEGLTTEEVTEEGIGGTGQVASNQNSTGSNNGSGGIGGTGIVGTITAFGSIWVNDAHVTFNEQTPITINQQPATSGEFQIGQVVAVIADKSVNAANQSYDYPAKSIDIIYEVAGPVSQILAGDQSLEILNQSVLVNDQTTIFEQSTGKTITLAQLDLGDHIEVSGLRQTDGDIIASRLDIVDEMSQIQLIGELEQTSEGHWQINNQTVEIDELLADELLDTENADHRVLISGQLEDEVFHVESINTDSVEYVLEQVNELIYEGYLLETHDDGTISIGGFEFDLHDAIEFEEVLEAYDHDESDEEYDYDESEEDAYDEEYSEEDEDIYEDDTYEEESYEEDEIEQDFYEGWESDDFDPEEAHDEDIEVEFDPELEEEGVDDEFLEEEFEEEFDHELEQHFEEDMEPEFDDAFFEEEFEEHFEEEFEEHFEEEFEHEFEEHFEEDMEPEFDDAFFEEEFEEDFIPED